MQLVTIEKVTDRETFSQTINRDDLAFFIAEGWKVSEEASKSKKTKKKTQKRD